MAIPPSGSPTRRPSPLLGLVAIHAGLILACTGGSSDRDRDDDGWDRPEDCDDDNAEVHPDAPELCDGIDNDCDTLIDDQDDNVDAPSWYVDADGDGFGDP